jgi:Protein of unknown function (DUF3617)
MKFMAPSANAAIVAVLVLTAAPAARADGLQAGQWQVITKPQNNGVAGPPLQNMRCLSATDVGDLEKTFSPVSRTTNSTCEQTEHEASPQRLKWRLQCTGQIDMDVAGEFVFDSPEHYTATVTARSSMMGRVMNDVHTVIEGQRVGDCPTR